VRLVNDTPMYGSYSLELIDGGTIVNLSSALLIGQSGELSLGGAGGQVFQDGGLIQISGATLFGGNFFVTNGLFKSDGYFELGPFYSGEAIYSGLFNQYGGTVEIWLTDCGEYHLYGGT